MHKVKHSRSLASRIDYRNRLTEQSTAQLTGGRNWLIVVFVSNNLNKTFITS